MTGRWLHIHVGYEKTASNVIQHALMDLRPALRDHGLDYPVLEVGPDGYPRSGNAAHAFARDARRHALLDAADPAAHRGTVLSCEVLLLEQARRRNLRAVAQEALERGYDGLRFLLFVRDPARHGPSLWQQYLRTERALTTPLGPWLAETYDHPRLTADFLEAAEEIPHVEVEAHNHARLDAPVDRIALRWLGLPDDLTPGPLPKGRDNVAMSPSQAALLLAINRHDASCRLSALTGVALRLADMRADHRRSEADAASLRAMFDRIEPDLARAERFLPPTARYDRHAPEAAEDGEPILRFLPEEIEAIARALGETSSRLHALEQDIAWRSPRARLDRMRRRWRRLRGGLRRRLGSRPARGG